MHWQQNKWSLRETGQDMERRCLTAWCGDVEELSELSDNIQDRRLWADLTTNIIRHKLLEDDA